MVSVRRDTCVVILPQHNFRYAFHFLSLSADGFLSSLVRQLTTHAIFIHTITPATGVTRWEVFISQF